ncbi:MAG: hypothetical protein HQK62_12845, partial [Desulfamplus sp.]|nr:hypothetical protein [Desulfamplus sp.]
DLFDTLNRSLLSDAVGKIRKTLPDLLNYFDQAVSIIESLKQQDLDEKALKALCAGWQWHKGLVKSKITARRHYCQENELFCLEIAEGYLQEQYEDLKDRVYHELNHVVQSSAMVECINSIIRSYLNTSRNQITREMLNLIMFYHNHRRYKRGERAGKTPYEILTGKEQKKDWLELLFDIINNSGGPLLNDFICHDPGQAETNQILTFHRTSDDYAVAIRASR